MHRPGPLEPVSSEPPRRSKRRWLYALVGLASTAVFATLALGRLELSDVGDALTRARLWPWLPIALVAYLVGQVVRGVRCRLLVSSEVDLPLVTATNVVVLGYAVNNILPARLGELARAGMLSERTGLPYVQSLSVTFVERVLDGLVMIGLLAVTWLLLPTAGWVATTVQLAAILFAVASAGIAVATIWPAGILRLVSRLSARAGVRVHDRLVGFASSAVGATAYLRSPGAALRIGLLSALVWIVEASMFLALMPAFGLVPDYRAALLVMTITNLGILAPSTPGFVGPFHYFCMRALLTIGAAEATALSYAVVAHLTFYLPITLWGVIILLSAGFKWGHDWERRHDARPLELPDDALSRGYAPPPDDAVPSAFTTALVEAMLPLERDGVRDADRREVIQQTSSFVQGQLDALPARLRLLYSLGTRGFRALTLMRYLRTFCSVPLDQRRAWVAAWTWGNFALGRQLFRAVRATAFMAYYDHDVVRRAVRAEPQRPGPVVRREGSPVREARA